ncbi:MoaD/ThiS family protein [Microbacterium suaedae]|uniref:MoaD/ThiS family protein n=1 Tax=Microbacterium suaedae TaxID=2067813 RepID=UPI000DA153F8|nr:MoaD/ThiS family protein [Microbacterium suaedae]
MTLVRFFAAAEEAAGTAEETRSESTLDALRAALVADHPGLGGILPRCAVLIDGARRDGDATLTDTRTVDILPPFAGG